MGVVGLNDEKIHSSLPAVVARPGGMLNPPAGRPAMPKFCSIHSFSCNAICNPTPSMFVRLSDSISRCSSDMRFLAQIVCSTPFLPWLRAEAPSSVGKMAGRGVIRQTVVSDDDDDVTSAIVLSDDAETEAGLCVSVMIGGMVTPGSNKKYKRCTSCRDRSLALNTILVLLWFSHATCHSPGRRRVLASSCHSTIRILVPSFPRPDSNSKRASAVDVCVGEA